MATTESQIRSRLRDRLLAEFKEWAEETYGTALQVKGNKIAVSVLDENDDDRWAEFTIAIPTGARDDDDGYDAEGMAEDYEMHLEEVKAKKERKAKELAEKQAERKRKKEEKAALKASEKEG